MRHNRALVVLPEVMVAHMRVPISLELRDLLARGLMITVHPEIAGPQVNPGLIRERRRATEGAAARCVVPIAPAT